MARLSFRCDEDLLARVDAARGHEPREHWLRRAVERALGDAEAVTRSRRAAEAIVARPDRVSASAVKTARELLADERYLSRAHAPSCKCPVCS